MANIENGVIIQEITIRRPSSGMVGVIIRAQAELPNRLLHAKWIGPEGKTVASVTIKPNEIKTSREIQKLSVAVGKVDQLTIQEIFPF